MILIRLSILLILFLSLSLNLASGQSIITSTSLQLKSNSIPAVPFLTFAPDARSGSLGDAGVATSPDINSQHWNPAKYAFLDSKWGITASYTPWLRKLSGDINLVYTTGFYRINNRQVISTSLRYFSLGDIIFLTVSGNIQDQFNPKEMALDVAYSRLLSENLSFAIALRYIYSDLSGGNLVSGNKTKPGRAIAGDLALFHNNNIRIFKHDAKLAFGLNISNIGNKVTYSDEWEKQFLPANLRLGSTFSMNLGKNNSVCIITDINKLLVPIYPIYINDSLGNRTILYGKDPNVSVPLSLIRSFWDAPGILKKNGERSVLLEELHEIKYSFGAEYCYRNKFVLRSGYFHEHETKGNRKYFAMGIGFRISAFEMDIGYLLPINKSSPYANTFRFTLSFKLGKENTDISDNRSVISRHQE
jgi:hypothetical protein